MNRLLFPSFRRCFMSLTRQGFFAGEVHNCRLFCSSSNPIDIDNEDNIQNDPRSTEGKHAGETDRPARESIHQRLMRLSQQSPDEFVPSDSIEETEQKRWDRYQNSYFPDQKLRTRHAGRQRESGTGFFNEGFANPSARPKSFYENPNRRSASISSRSSSTYRNSSEDYFDDLEDNESNHNYSARRNNQNRYDENFKGNPRHQFQRDRGRRYDDEDDSHYKDKEFTASDLRRMQRKFGLDESDVNFQRESPVKFRDDENRNHLKEKYLNQYVVVNKNYGASDDMNDDASNRSDPDPFNFGGKREYRGPPIKDFDSLGKKKFHTLSRRSNLLQGTFIKTTSPCPFSTKFHYGQNENNLTEAAFRSSPFKVKQDDIIESKTDDSDVFGNLKNSQGMQYSLDETLVQNIGTVYDEEEEGDIRFQPEIRTNMRRLMIGVKDLLEKKKLTEALDFFQTSLSEPGFKYDKGDLAYLYRVIITECAKAGYQQAAFKLFKKMQNYGLYIKPAVYTSLFNSCATSPWLAEKNILRLDGLRASMTRSGYEPNLINYHAMIKGYGRCGDIEKAFGVVDEMTERKQRLVRPNSETYAFLLQACITDKINGYRHALLVWKKMLTMRIRPTLPTFQLLLKCTRECGVEIPKEMQKEIRIKQEKLKRLEQTLEEKDQKDVLDIVKHYLYPGIDQAEYLAKNAAIGDNLFRIQTLLQVVNSNDLKVLPRNTEVESRDSARPTRLSDPGLEIICRLQYPNFRLLMLGGVRGVMQQMREAQVKPDIKIFQELVMTATAMEIMDILNLMDAYNIKTDIQFYNVLIKRLNECKLVKEARNVLKKIGELRLSPDIYTWSALAFGCSSWSSAENLLVDIEAANFTISEDLMGTLISQARYHYDPYYLTRLMQENLRRNVHTTPEALKKIEKFRQIVHESILQWEKGEPVTNPKMARKLEQSFDEFMEGWRDFKLYYEEWLAKVDFVYEPTDPWAEDFAKRFPRPNFSNPNSTFVQPIGLRKDFNEFSAQNN